MLEAGKYQRLTVGTGLRVMSFFSGAGGLDLGFELTGYDVIYATDIDEMCCRTLKENLGGLLSPHTVVECADIRKIDLKTLPKNIDLIIGGPPCQSFSASGRRAGGAAGRLDDKGTLFETYCSIINYVKPKAFLFENVRGILSTNKGEDWKVILEAFLKIGYKVNYRILDALDYGAPQQRERMILVGHKLDTEFLFPRPLYGPDSVEKRPYISANAVISTISDDTENKDSLILKNGKYSHLLPLVPPGENYLFFTAKRGYANPIFAYRSRFSDFLYKAHPDKPIKTLIASPGKYTGPLHWDNRYFTVKEYMRLQGFPDEYRFIGDRADKIKQIGNSVSPNLSYQIAIAIAKQIFNRDVAVDLISSDYSLSFDSRKGRKAAKTREKHNIVALKPKSLQENIFTLSEYNISIQPNRIKHEEVNVSVKVDGNSAKMTILTDNSNTLFCRLQLEIFQSENGLSDSSDDPIVILEVFVYGSTEHTIQTMWNIIDNWVTRSSSFHSIFELYGHFTEPHPIFRINNFINFTDEPISAFAKHVSNFNNCSRYFPRHHLTDMFGITSDPESFIYLVKLLRSYRFDIRCYETNIAIPKDVYMVAYPFTLPFGKQMNFSLKNHTLPKSTVLLNS